MFVRATIREHFQQVQKRITASVIAIVVAVVLLAAYVFFHQTQQAELIGGIAIGIGVILAVILLVKRPSACPQCHANLAALQKQEPGSSDSRPFWERWDKCPKCGIDFNDALPS